MKKISELTGLRCLAVMMVVIGHAAQTAPGGYSGWLLPLKIFAAYQGVVIFFVLSGYLITGILKDECEASGRINLPQFYARRALRIWPASYTFILAIALLTVAGAINVAWQQFLFAALHVWNYFGPFGLREIHASHPDGALYFSHFWSLALEEQFYWVWPPILILILRRKTDWLLPALILLVPLVRMATYVLVPSLRDYLGMMLPTGVDAILIGCYARLKQEKIKALFDSSSKTPALLTAGALVLFLVIPPIAIRFGGYWAFTYGRTIEAAMAAILVVALVHLKDFWLSRVLRTRAFVFIGTISFSLYLWQQLFLFNIGTPFALAFPLNIIQSLAAACLNYWLIEKPFLLIKERRSKRVPTTQLAPLNAAQMAQTPPG